MSSSLGKNGFLIILDSGNKADGLLLACFCVLAPKPNMETFVIFWYVWPITRKISLYSGGVLFEFF